jgi:DNA-binding CsgD family transcriptional regulator
VRELSRDQAAWLDFVADLLQAPLAEWPDDRVAAQLRETFELTTCSYSDVQAGRPRQYTIWPLSDPLAGNRQLIEEWAATRAPAEHPVLRFYLATGNRVPLQNADVPERFADRRTQAAWREVGGLGGCPDQLALPLRLDAGGHRAFVLGRDGCFSEAEVALATRIWRLLTGLDRQIGAVAAMRRSPDVGMAEPCSPGSPLTPREASVLHLLARGLTARAIGHQLLIGERTVHKHLERIYAKLDVTDRLSAVLRAQHLGLLPPIAPSRLARVARGPVPEREVLGVPAS